MAKINLLVPSDSDVFIMPTCLGIKAVKVIIFRRKKVYIFFIFRSKHSLRVHVEPAAVLMSNHNTCLRTK